MLSWRRLSLRGAMLLAALVWCVAGTTPMAVSVDAGAAGPRVDREFLARHWRGPLRPQGVAPKRWSALERALAPEACGSCHPLQLADWSSGFHARSMGPGIAGQLVEMTRTDPESARACHLCHAPLAEQSAEIVGQRGAVANEAFDARLRERGAICAACHVQSYQRFGTPRRD